MPSTEEMEQDLARLHFNDGPFARDLYASEDEM